jgi:hypothetical protein
LEDEGVHGRHGSAGPASVDCPAEFPEKRG